MDGGSYDYIIFGVLKLRLYIELNTYQLTTNLILVKHNSNLETDYG